MSDPKQSPSSVEIKNKASNLGAQGIFNGPVFFGFGPSAVDDRRNRERMLERVQILWIDGVLEKSLHHATLIVLGLHEQPNLVENPWRMIIQEINQPERLLPTGTHILQVYDDVKGGLLILGEPGSGKTTLLLELARGLLDRARQDQTHTIPVIFNLSSWAVQRRPIKVWLVEELNTKYQVPYKIGESWVSATQILPLLDGLDEVAKEHRSACIEAINIYQREYGLPLVVCSRSSEYLMQTKQLLLQNAVVIQPLTDEQVEDYLQSAGDQLEALRQALQEDPELSVLAHRPLMLSIFTLAYEGVSLEDLPKGEKHGSKPRQVFAAYVERMLKRRGVLRRVDPERLLRVLAFLARQMQRHDQTVFYLERVRPDWLETPHLRRLYWFTLIVVGMLIGVLISSLIASNGYVLTSSLLAGLSFTQLRILDVVLGFTAGAIIPVLLESSKSIEVAEDLRWSLKKALPVVLVIGLFSMLLVWLTNNLDFWIRIGLAAGLPSLFLYGISVNQLDEHLHLKPNQGIWRSGRYGLFFLLFVWFGAGLFITVIYERFHEPLAIMIAGLGPGLFGGLLFGLYPFLRHFFTRFWLWRAGIPWRIVPVLDEAANRLLLRKVGGGYIFIHRLLLDYFASQNSASSSTEIERQADLIKGFGN